MVGKIGLLSERRSELPPRITIPAAAIVTILLLWGTIAVASRVPRETRLPGVSTSSDLDYAPEARALPPLRSSFLEARLGAVLGGAAPRSLSSGALRTGPGGQRTSASRTGSQNNDYFADAEELDPPSESDHREVSQASLEDGEPQDCGSVSNTVWYRFAPDRRMRVSVDNMGSDFVTVIAAYEGTKIADLRRVGCAAGESAGVGFTGERGSTYYFQVGASSGPGVEPSSAKDLVVNFAVSELPPLPPRPANDNFSSGAEVNSVPYGGEANTASATLESSEPLPSCRRPAARVEATVWYMFTSSEDVLVLAEAAGYDTIVAVYTGTELGSLHEVACNGLSSAPTRSTAAFSAKRGATYAIQVGAEDGDGGSLDFRMCRGEQGLGGCREKGA